jgi:hypothetical protein
MCDSKRDGRSNSNGKFRLHLLAQNMSVKCRLEKREEAKERRGIHLTLNNKIIISSHGRSWNVSSPRKSTSAPLENSCWSNIQPPLWLQRITFTINCIVRFFFASSSLSFPSTLAPHHRLITLYTMSINEERRVTLYFSPSCPPWPDHDSHLPFAPLLLIFSNDRMEWQQI